MRHLLHISDLHFGRVDSTVVAALAAAVAAIAPDLIVVSGDLTQRAKRREFAAARAFLDALTPPKVIVPGNHDIPLYNIAKRFLSPLKGYLRFVTERPSSTFIDDELIVVGINTARSLTFKGGRINAAQVQHVRQLFCESGDRVRILVSHHPFHLAGASRRDLLGRAGMALSVLRECMPDILLAGHMHAHETGTTGARYDLGGPSALVVQAGTATSTRGRGERNSFNLLQIDADVVTVCRYDWIATNAQFAPAAARRYVRHGLRWEDDKADGPQIGE